MSTESLTIALRHSRATGTAKLILVGIANHDGDGGAWPSIATLAIYGGVTARNAQKAIDRLVALGEIRVHHRQGGNSRTPEHARPNLYEVLLKCPPDCDGTKNHKSKYELPDPLSVATPPVGSDTPPPVGSDTPPPVGSDTRTIHRTTHRNRSSSQGDQQSARKVTPAPSLPRLAEVGNVPKIARRIRSADELAELAQLEAEPCPSSPGFTHWFPADMTECARGCATTLTTTERSTP